MLRPCASNIRWLVRHLQSVQADLKAQCAAHHLALEKVIQTQNETALKLAISIDRNTHALSDCSFELRRFQGVA